MWARVFLFFLFHAALLALILVYLVPVIKRFRNEAEKAYNREKEYLNPIEDKLLEKQTTVIEKQITVIEKHPKLPPITIGKKILCKSCKTKKLRGLGKGMGKIVVHEKDCAHLKRLLDNSVEV